MESVIDFFTRVTKLIPTDSQKALLETLVDPTKKKIIVSCGRQTGKTLTSAVATVWLSLNFKYRIVLCSAQDSWLYNHIRNLFDNNLDLRDFVVSEGVFSIVPLKGYETKNGSVVHVRGATEKQLRGVGADLVILDEAAEMTSDTVTTALGNLSGPVSKIILLSTPHKSSLFTEIVNDPTKYDFEVFTWSAENCSWHGKELLATKKKMLTMQKYKVEVLGLPLNASERAFFPPKQIDACVLDIDVLRQGDSKSTVEAGIDWGGSVSKTCLTITERQGTTKRKILEQKSWKGPWELYSDDLVSIMRKWGVGIVKADSQPVEFKGLLEKYGYRPEYIIMAQHKSAMLGQLQKRFRHKQIIIPIGFKDLVIELKKYRHNTKDELEYTSYKANKRLGDDRIDSLALSCYEPIVPIENRGHSGLVPF